MWGCFIERLFQDYFLGLEAPYSTRKLINKKTARQTQLHGLTPVAGWFELLGRHHNVRYENPGKFLEVSTFEGIGISGPSHLFRRRGTGTLFVFGKMIVFI